MNTLIMTKPRRAFTLIELLVVITIVAILAAILFPVFAQAKEAAKKASCLSNTKQVALSWMMYANDYDDLGIPYIYTEGPTVLYSWYARIDVLAYLANPSTYEPDLKTGLIQPYMKSTPLVDCPSAKGMPTAGINSGAIGYGLNIGTYGPGPSFAAPSMSSMDAPADTILMADAGALSATSPGALVRKWVLAKPSQITADGKVHARHGGEVANINWYDGHAKSFKLNYVTFDIAPAIGWTAENMKKSKLGDILRGPRTGIPAQDDYYYTVAKP